MQYTVVSMPVYSQELSHKRKYNSTVFQQSLLLSYSNNNIILKSSLLIPSIIRFAFNNEKELLIKLSSNKLI